MWRPGGGVVLVGLMLVGAAAWGYAAEKDGGQSEIDLDAPLCGVLVREKDVFAANGKGVYRALIADRQWKELKMPEGVLGTGQFAIEPAEAKAVYYFVRSDDKGKAGLYRSEDDGETWRQMSEAGVFRRVVLQKDESLVAITVGMMEPVELAGAGKVRGGRALGSRDGGKTWRVLIEDKGIFLDACPDPEHAPQIRLFCSNWNSSFWRPMVDTYDPKTGWCEWEEEDLRLPPRPERFGEEYWKALMKCRRGSGRGPEEGRRLEGTVRTFFEEGYENLFVAAEKYGIRKKGGEGKSESRNPKAE